MPIPTTKATNAVSHWKVSDKIYKVIKDWIMLGELVPGERLQPREIAERLNASMTPVKEALQRLAGEGLIEIIPRRGMFVSRLSLRDVEELLEIRLLHEAFAGRQAIAKGFSDSDIRRLESRMKTLERLSAQKTLSRPDVFAEADREFHRLIVRMSGNSQLAKLCDQLNQYINNMRIFYFNNETRAKLTTQEHKAIYEAFAARDVYRFQAAVEAHIRGVQSEFAEYFQAHPDLNPDPQQN